MSPLLKERKSNSQRRSEFLKAHRESEVDTSLESKSKCCVLSLGVGPARRDHTHRSASREDFLSGWNA